MRIAVIGAGVSGLTSAYVLSKGHEVTLFEREPRLGGHAHTHEVQSGGATWPVDTGFMVFNERTYPNFIRLLGELGVSSRASDMSFGVRCRRCGLEYSSVGMGGLFAQPSRWFSAGHWMMLTDILRFFKRGRRALADGLPEGQSLGEFLRNGGHGDGLVRHFVLPMGAAIWSSSNADLMQFPALSFLRFLDNHGLLRAAGQPVWRTIVGGSVRYVTAIAERLGAGVRVAAPVRRVSRTADGADVETAAGVRERFDRVVIATHADEALRMLADPSAAERAALGRFRYSANDTWLHSDERLLPSRPAARASWNCELLDCRDERASVSVTYDLNRLQGHTPGRALLCSLNPREAIQGDVLAHMDYRHPILDGAAFEGQGLVRRLNGQRHTFYCGAHLRYGFHEDGVMSALDVTRALGADL